MARPPKPMTPRDNIVSIEALAGFVPRFVPTRLVERIDCTAPSEARFEGAALFADISGYTELTEALLARGEEGLGELSALLDRAFGRYVDLVHIHGGEVVHFAGDALLAYWAREGSATMADVARSAVQCAEHLVAATSTRGHATNAAPALHVGVGSGGLWVAHVGGDDYAHLIFGGGAVRDALRMGNIARRGESLCSEAARALLGSAEARGWREGPSSASRHTPVPVTPSSLARLVPRVVLERAARDEVWAAELRHTTSLFAGVDGIDEDGPSALERIGAVVRAVHDAIAPFSSSPGRWLIDDRRLVFVVVFGVPFNAHGDDHVRALRAGGAIDAALEALGAAHSIGVASGTAFCGPIGAADRREYVTVGRPLNLAARLMAARQGLLYAGPRGGFDGDDVELTPVPPLRAKGFADAIAAFAFRATSTRPTATRTLHGRNAERDVLDRALDRLRGGEAGAVVVEGDAGLGKSSLVAELLRSAKAHGVHTFVAENAAAEHSPALAPWRRIFGALLHAEPSQDAAALGRWVQSWLAPYPELSPFAPLLAQVLRAELPESDATRHLEGPARTARAIRVLAEVADAALPRPALVVLEDAHWMDPESWRLACAVASLAGVLVVVTTRPVPAHAEEAAFRGQRGTLTLSLGPLEPDAVTAVARDCLASGTVGTALAASVNALAGGNPLVATEYVRLLQESRRAVLQGGHWVLLGRDDHSPDSRTPVTVRSLLVSRLDHLTSAQSRALKAAAAIGRTFSIELLGEVLGATSDETRRLLGELASHQLAEARAAEPGGAWGFHSSLLRDVVYELMLPDQRRALHVAIAGALERQRARGERAEDALLAHHWSGSGDLARTMPYADAAGTRALSAGAYREAIYFVSLCLKGVRAGAGLPEPATLVRWHRQLADAHHGLGDLAARRAEATSALEAADRSTSPSAAAKAQEVATRLARELIRTSLPDWTRSGSGRSPGPYLDLAKAYRHLVEVAYFDNDGVGMLWGALHAVDAAERAGLLADLSRAYAQLGGALGVAGAPPLATRFLRRAIHVAAAASEPYAEAYAHMCNCLYSVGVGAWSAVEESAGECQRMSARTHDAVTWGNAQIVLCWMHYYRGDGEASRRAANELRERAARAGQAQQEAWALSSLGLLATREGAHDEAVRVIEEARALQTSTRDSNELIPTQSSLALARWLAGDAEGAREAASEAVRLAEAVRRPTSHGTGGGFAAAVEVAVSLLARAPDSSEAKDLARRAIAALARYRRVFPVVEPAFLRWRGEARLLAGERRSALVDLRAAVHRAEALGMRPDADAAWRRLATVGRR